jgi:hypothetical protein
VIGIVEWSAFVIAIEMFTTHFGEFGAVNFSGHGVDAILDILFHPGTCGFFGHEHKIVSNRPMASAEPIIK